MRQFGCRRGFPDKLYSDNGSNYRKASKEIVNGLNSWPENEIAEFCSLRKCQWYFNPPLAPHIGGAWERLIQSVKKHLDAVLLTKHPKEYVLRTLF